MQTERKLSNLSMLQVAKTSKLGQKYIIHDFSLRGLYIEMHEFEALLFSDADTLAEKTEIDIALIRRIIETHDNPEEINDNPANAPGKRLESLKKGYRKVAMGKTVSEAIGIERIRRQCPHFNNWLIKLEQLRGM
jgi:hypothetical protein